MTSGYESCRNREDNEYCDRLGTYFYKAFVIEVSEQNKRRAVLCTEDGINDQRPFAKYRSINLQQHRHDFKCYGELPLRVKSILFCLLWCSLLGAKWSVPNHVNLGSGDVLEEEIAMPQLILWRSGKVQQLNTVYRIQFHMSDHPVLECSRFP